MKRNPKKIFLILCALSLTGAAQAQSWDLTGNSTSPGDFLGTLTGEPLLFRVDNAPAGVVDHLFGTQNTSLGQYSLSTNGGNGNTAMGFNSLRWPTGAANTAIGAGSMNAALSGSSNTAIGVNTLHDCNGEKNVAIGSNSMGRLSGVWITGSSNIGIGSSSLQDIKTGNHNISIGELSTGLNQNGSNNIAIGKQALYNSNGISNQLAIGTEALYNSIPNANPLLTGNNLAIGFQSQKFTTSSYRNTSVGNYALYTNVLGTENSAFGFEALLSNTNGENNTAIGNQSLQGNITGSRNTAVGLQALFRNSTGNDNTAVGGSALSNNSTGSGNSSLGELSLSQNSTGYSNASFGLQALSGNTTGYYNSASGANSLDVNTTGNSNSAFGFSANVLSNNLQNATAIGATAIVDVSNKVRIGNTSVTSIGGQFGWSTFSDARYKRNIKHDVPGIEFIKKLQPVTYTVDIEAINKHYDDMMEKNIPAGEKEEWKKRKAQCLSPTNPKASLIINTGFLAQDVEKAAKELNFDFSGVDKPENPESLYGLRYSEFVPPLVKAVQEQEAVIERLDKKNAELIQQNAALIERLEKLERIVGLQSSEKTPQSDNSSMQLQQNIPNPFSGGTNINYSIVEPGVVALKLYNAEGVELKNLENGYKQKGSYVYYLDGKDLQAGLYFYRLSLNGKELVRKAIKL